jgi:hypothetical protein
LTDLVFKPPLSIDRFVLMLMGIDEVLWGFKLELGIALARIPGTLGFRQTLWRDSMKVKARSGQVAPESRRPMTGRDGVTTDIMVDVAYDFPV